MELLSARLKYIPMTIDLAQTIMKNPLAFYYKYQLPWNRSWPHDGLKAMLPFYVESLEEDSNHLGFGPWIIMDIDQERVIGDIGFKGIPDEEGTVEVGYHIVETERNQGYATEALKAMCNWAFENEQISSVEAQCGKSNIPSQKVLINNGFAQTLSNRDMFTFQKKKQKESKKSTPSRKEI
ncbi:N-acetyltransferase [Halobacillus andaensis]|uniref:N-acetyltransferase n=1 Tax=Halobacillus andaensis TaxID=1176239 RepID=A0A917B099_HALAA|nr:GNAT family N-acetyltransferase [Halobacillus andaensis]MBP2003615.1 ribosomal-protein-alanine N-acetyltransferase [Halobacillus andaensis]GGF11975.1 N-acetyltransferase [Halobacillus andaensis]